MIADRKLTPEEKEKLRDFNTREILRRRFGNPEGAAEAEAEVDAEVAARLASGGASCPECGTPYHQRRGPKRCYRCKPTHPARPNPPVVASTTEPVDHIRGTTNPAVIVEPGPNATDHIRGVTSTIDLDPIVPVPHRDDTPALSAPPDPIAALRRVVDALDGLDRDAAKWVLQSAARLPRPDNSEPCP